MKYCIYVIISLFLTIGNTYAKSNNGNNKSNKSVKKISSYNTIGASTFKLFRKRYIIEKTYEKRKIYARKISKAHRTCVNTRPKKDPNLIER